MDVFEKAVKSSMLNVKNIDFNKIKQQQEQEFEKESNERITKMKVLSNEELIHIIKEKVPTLTGDKQSKVVALIGELNITSFDEPEKLDNEDLRKIYELIK